MSADDDEESLTSRETEASMDLLLLTAETESLRKATTTKEHWAAAYARRRDKVRKQTKKKPPAEDALRSLVGRSKAVAAANASMPAELLSLSGRHRANDSVIEELPTRTEDTRLSSDSTVDCWDAWEADVVFEDQEVCEAVVADDERAEEEVDSAPLLEEVDSAPLLEEGDSAALLEEGDLAARHASVGCQVDDALLSLTADDAAERKRAVGTLLQRQERTSAALRACALLEDDSESDEEPPIHFDVGEARRRAKRSFLRVADVSLPAPDGFSTKGGAPQQHCEVDSLAASLERHIAQGQLALDHVKGKVAAQNYAVLLEASQRARGTPTFARPPRPPATPPLTASLERRAADDIQSAWAAYNDVEDYVAGAKTPPSSASSAKACHRSRLPWRDPKASALW